jgi:Carboxypeptidase regulatory-like domain
VPNINVTARNAATNTASAPVVTNPQGYFQTPNLPAGRYRICVSGAGFASTCDDAVVEDIGPYVLMNHFVLIRPEENAIIGTVTLADHHTPCFWFRPSISPAALTAKASVLSVDGKIIAGPVEGNVAGQYVLPVAQTADRAKLHVECDAGVVEINVTPFSGVTAQNLAVASSTPSILGFDFSKNGVGIRRADPGDIVTVTVLAKDPDGNPLHYAWVDDSGHSLNLPDAPTVQWPLLNADAVNTLHVQVSNNKGGVAWSSRAIQSGPNAIFFSGHVFNRQTNAGVAGATVSLNGATVTTDASGNFQTSVPDASRFLLNVTHAGFALSSLVLINQAFGVQVPLDPVQTATVNGASGGSISVPPGSPAACNCTCKADGRSGDDERFHILVEIPDTRIDIRHGEEKKGEKGVVQAPSCVPSGGAGSLELSFEPGSFVSASGASYTGTVSVEAFQYDLNQPNPIPGDFGAIYQGKLVRLGTFGAFHILPRDGQGNPLTMAAGKQASVSMPIQAGQLAVAPATIPLFHYDENSGNWLEDGTLTRSGDRYVGQITHFSVFNADTVFPGGACVKVRLYDAGHAQWDVL